MGYWIYPVIFFVKIIEVSIATTRIILMTKGKKILSALLSIAEVSIWLILMSTVITNIQTDPLRMIVYVLGCSIGIYVGSSIEDLLALGHSTIYIIAEHDDGNKLADVLRSKNFGVTLLPAQGKDEFKLMMILHVKRKRQKEATGIIEETCPNAVITVNESKTVINGYGLRK